MPEHRELVERATSLVPVLRTRAGEAETLRRVPDENVAALQQGGLFKILQARRHGGYQMPLHTHIDAVAARPPGAWA
jgi:3-hydroxy-9,10-secoandrosta-1,3,5(10)-triene-9,17-dione monooxygenase